MRAVAVAVIFIVGCTCDGRPGQRPRPAGSSTELHQAPAPVFTARATTPEGQPTGEPLPEAAKRRFVVELSAGRQATITVEADGLFTCALSCTTIRGRAYRARGGVAFPGIGLGPDKPLVVPLGPDGAPDFARAPLARGSSLDGLCR